MVESSHDPTPRELSLHLNALDARINLHMKYQEEAVNMAAKELHERLEVIHTFLSRLEERGTTFATQDNMELRASRMLLKLETLEKWYDDRTMRLDNKIDLVATNFQDNFGKRVSALEIAKSNLEGRFWALTAIMVLLEVGMQVWQRMVGH